MLEFAAKDFLEAAHRFGLILGEAKRPTQTNPDILGNAIGDLLVHCGRLGLKVTVHQIGTLLEEVVRECPDSISVDSLKKGDVVIRGAKLRADRNIYHLEAVYSTMVAEIGSRIFKAIPHEKTRFCDPKWLFDTPIYKQFPHAWNEFQSAGRCFAYGENTACAFHLGRVLEWGLKSLAVHLGRRFDRNNWERHLDDIEKELKTRYTAAIARSREEIFYSEAATQFGNMKVAWRNPTMHVEAKYDENEGAYLIAAVEQFMMHLAENNLKEVQS